MGSQSSCWYKFHLVIPLCTRVMWALHWAKLQRVGKKMKGMPQRMSCFSLHRGQILQWSTPAATGKQKHGVPTREPGTHTARLEAALGTCESSKKNYYQVLMVKDKQNSIQFYFTQHSRLGNHREHICSLRFCVWVCISFFSHQGFIDKGSRLTGSVTREFPSFPSGQLLSISDPTAPVELHC